MTFHVGIAVRQIATKLWLRKIAYTLFKSTTNNSRIFDKDGGIISRLKTTRLNGITNG